MPRAAETRARRSADSDRKSRFNLHKWYLDVIGPDGAAAIGYWADLRWGPLHITHSSLLRMDAAGRVESRSTHRSCGEPELNGKNLRWSAPRLNVAVRLEGISPGIELTLLDSDEGQVRWSCHMPRARAVFETASGPISGWGYAECLSLTIRPWRLPIDELRWGRFLSDDTDVVWIRWKGAEPRTLVLCDGVEVSEVSIEDNHVGWPNGNLRLHPGRTLRNGALGATVLADRPLIRAMTPRAIRSLQEHKQVSHGELTRPGLPAAAGWAIHEVVRFRNSSP